MLQATTISFNDSLINFISNPSKNCKVHDIFSRKYETEIFQMTLTQIATKLHAHKAHVSDIFNFYRNSRKILLLC